MAASAVRGGLGQVGSTFGSVVEQSTPAPVAKAIPWRVPKKPHPTAKIDITTATAHTRMASKCMTAGN